MSEYRISQWRLLSIRRRFIGKKIKWRQGGSLLWRTGTVEACQRTNVLVDGDWVFFPRMESVYCIDNAENSPETQDDPEH